MWTRLISIFLLATTLLFADEGKVSLVIGSVDVLRSGSDQWEPVRLDGNVANGDRIRTKLQSRCEIELPDQSLLQISENTVFEVKIVDSPAEEEYSFFLWLGNITAKFKKLFKARQSRTIESPSAVVAVRGTEFAMQVQANKATYLRVYEGSVEYTSKSTGGSVLVGANQSSEVSEGQDPTQPEEDEEASGELIPENDESGLDLRVNLGSPVITDPAVRANGLSLPGSALPGATVNVAGSPIQVDASGRFRAVVPVTEGLNRFDVVASKDAASVSQSVRVFVNTEYPRLTIKRPVNLRYTNQSRYELEGAVTDNTPLDQVEIFVSGRKMGTFAPKSNFRFPIILREGENEMLVVASDRSGNATQEVERLFLDTIKPQIVVIKPAASGQVINLPPNPPGNTRQKPRSYIVSGRIIDPQPSSGIERITVNGEAVRLAPNGQFERTIQLQVGVNQILFIALDLAGNEQRVTSSVVVRRGNQ
jgi:hypothetical protein